MIIDKYQRSLFNDLNEINTIQEPDLISNSFLEFEFKRTLQSYEVTSSDLQRPDLISYRNYGKTNLWWIIAKYNKIEDIWNDLYIGQILDIPAIQDIDEFAIKKRK